ncbi:MAG: phosphodiesterase [Halochromatium sp.]|nr:phosphodiesterase [Halochromatium sp.]
MIRKITINQLRKGMYVHDLNCGWLDQMFLWSAFLVSSESILRQIHALGIQELYIDTDKGSDVASAQTQAEVEQELDDALNTIAKDYSNELPELSLSSEQRVAADIRTEATSLIQSLMDDIRLGRSLDAEQVTPVVEKLTESILRNQDALLGLQRIRHSDLYTFEHSVNVSVLMVAFSKSLELDQRMIKELGLGALLHDIGKTLTPKEILNKPGRLTEPEFKRMQHHVDDGERILSQAQAIPASAVKIVSEHHEKIDGSGYPHGKSGSEISLYGQMASIVDVYDAITSDRVYHRGLEPSEALRKLLEWSNYHFAPKLVQQFIRCVGIYPIGTLVRLTSGRIAAVVESSRSGLLKPVVRICFDPRQQRHLAFEDLDLSDPSISANERILRAEQARNVPIDIQQVMSAIV